MTTTENSSQYHKTRLRYTAKRKVLWTTLWKAYFKRFIKPSFHVMDLGAGYCDFINAVECQRRTAIDVWEGVVQHAADGVMARQCSVTELGFLEDGSVDFALASNVFEHLIQEEVIRCLQQLHTKLKPGGTLVVIQPNFKYAYREYFDDYTHRTIFTETGLSDLLESCGFDVEECHARFLPFSLNSRLPLIPFLVRCYLWFPVKPFAKQMLIRARTRMTPSSNEK
jgi:SAM-dependent methyltransferase